MLEKKSSHNEVKLIIPLDGHLWWNVDYGKGLTGWVAKGDNNI